MTASYSKHGDVAVITVSNPPVNALSAAMRRGILDGVGRAEADPDIAGTVIIGDRVFIAGADIREFGQAASPPGLRDLYPVIEAARKPVVAALAGAALGGGLELALACHFRIALRSAKVGLPEVRIGLLPGGGGTVRLPRLAGAEAALDMMLSGKHVTASEALALGIVDEVVDDDLLGHATALARRLHGGTLPRVRDLSLPASQTNPGLFDGLRRKNAVRWRGLTAPWQIVDCVEKACSASFDEAYAFEAHAFRKCLDSPARTALIHAFFAERAAAKVPGIAADVRARPIRKAGVIGAGTMGGGISMTLANSGIAVVQLDMSGEALARGRKVLERNYAVSVERGSMAAAARDRALALISSTTEYADLADCDIVIEAAFEDMAVKREVFGRLDAVMREGAILASNTSTLDIDAIAAATRRPGDVVGTHFFSPANVMKLQENIRGAATAPDVIVTVMELAKRIGKVPVLSGNCDGFIGNRILAVYGREADFILEEGSTPWEIDDALMAFGFPMGVYRMRDMAGLDVGWRIRQHREATRDKSTRYSPVADRLCEAGRFGQKSGAGYYRYDGRTAVPDPDIQDLVERTAADLGIQRAAIGPDEIVNRILTAMVNEAANILDEGIAARPGDIDVVYLNGYGFPRHEGGPMFWGARRGLTRIMADIRRYHATHGALWTASRLLVDLEAKGAAFPA